MSPRRVALPSPAASGVPVPAVSASQPYKSLFCRFSAARAPLGVIAATAAASTAASFGAARLELSADACGVARET